MKSNGWVTWAIVMLALLGLVTGAQATPLPPGSSGVSITNLGDFTGTVLTSTVAAPYSFTGGTGTVSEWVVLNGTGALCVGCLSFVYQVHVATGSVGAIFGAQYDTVTVDVTHFIGPSASLAGSLAGGSGANEASRSLDGNTVSFNFTSPINPSGGGNSFLEIANTFATSFTAGTIFVDGNGANDGSIASIPGFAPGAAAVPEPGTVLLIGSGLVALGVWRRRR